MSGEEQTLYGRRVGIAGLPARVLGWSYGPVAQRSERSAHNRLVVGSIPTGPTRPRLGPAVTRTLQVTTPRERA